MKETRSSMEVRLEHERRRRTRRVKQPQVLSWVEFLQAAGILCMVTATPWLFGTTEDWAIRLMNFIAYGLGAILLMKKILFFSYRERMAVPNSRAKNLFLTWTLNLLICSTLLYVLISALNARATFVLEEQTFIYHEGYRSWLPHSYDSGATWALFWQYLGMACFFWCLRDWLISDPSRSEHKDKRFLT
jgi:hypothetical protein